MKRIVSALLVSAMLLAAFSAFAASPQQKETNPTTTNADNATVETDSYTTGQKFTVAFDKVDGAVKYQLYIKTNDGTAKKFGKLRVDPKATLKANKPGSCSLYAVGLDADGNLLAASDPQTMNIYDVHNQKLPFATVTTAEEAVSNINTIVGNFDTDVTFNSQLTKSEFSRIKSMGLNNFAFLEKSISYSINFTRGTMKVSAKYDLAGQITTAILNESMDELSEEAKALNGTVKRMVDAITKNCKTTKDKAEAIYKYVIQNTKYDLEGTHKGNDTAKGALINGYAVCEGYAELYSLMLTVAGIQNRLISGTRDGGAHMWLLILIDGKWYHADPTSDDPVDRTDPMYFRYKHFLKTDAEMKKMKYVWDNNSYPKSK